MELTIPTIKRAVDEAFGILTECCPDFKKPAYEDIRICNRTHSWAYVHREYGRFTLYVSKLFETMDDENKFWTRLVGTMIHEAIHTQAGCFNHKEGFKRFAGQVNRKYPEYEVQRCNDTATWGADKTKMDHASWVIRCNHCGKDYTYMRRPKYLNSFIHGGGICPKCNGKGFNLVSFPPNSKVTLSAKNR